jgi:predicted PhzF superfamily epimerase YddE/YHI9
VTAPERRFSHGAVGGSEAEMQEFAAEIDFSEDPATGPSNGCLAGYLARHAYFRRGTVVPVARGELLSD